MNESTELPPHNDESDDTSMTEDCDSVDNSVDTNNIDNSLETVGQVSFKYNEIICELDELLAYKELVCHKFRAVFKQLQEVSVRGDIEGRIISGVFGDDYPQGGYRTLPPWQAPSRGKMTATSYSYPPEAIQHTQAAGQHSSYVMSP